MSLRGFETISVLLDAHFDYGECVFCITRDRFGGRSNSTCFEGRKLTWLTLASGSHLRRACNLG